MSIYEYDQEKHLRQEREASWEKGREVGKEEGREEGIKNLVMVLRDLGISEEIIKGKLREKYVLTEEQMKKYLQ